MIIGLILYLASMHPAQAVNLPALDAQICRMMTAHEPGADGDASYKPGVDVHGKPVVEADLNSTPLQSPEVVAFDMTVDMAQYLGVKVKPAMEGNAVIGRIEVDRQGHVTFNGKPMEGEAEASLRALCKPAQQPKKINYNQ